jgi:hypothetical protein
MYIKDFEQLLSAINEEINFKDASYSPIEIWGYNDLSRIKVSKEIIEYFNEIHNVMLIDGQKKYAISRKDVFNSYPKNDSHIEIISFFLTVLVWGYPNGGRGKNINNIISSKQQIIEQYHFIKENKSKLGLDEVYQRLNKGNLKIKGMGPSTFTKILYFMEFKDKNGVTALIFDNIMENVINSRRFFEIKEELEEKDINSLSNSNKNDYSYFCEIIKSISEELKTPIFALDYFLFYISRTI